MNAVINYVVLLLPFFFINCILCWGLNLQFGLAGIPNFTYITFMAVGAYFAGVTALPPPTRGVPIHYILGLNWPFPATMLSGGVVAGLVGLGLGAVLFRRLRSDYLAIVTFGLGFIAYDLVSTYTSVFNGFDGITGVPQPLNSVLGFDYITYVRFFAGLAAVVALLVGYVMWRISRAPLGRTLRAVRDDQDLAEALGKKTYRVRMVAMIVGCFVAGIGGALTVELSSTMNPSGWAPPETFVLFAAVLLGGRGNIWGSAVGAFIVPVLLLQVTSLISVPVSYAVQFEASRIALVGLLIIVVLWFRPDGIVPRAPRCVSQRRGAKRWKRGTVPWVNPQRTDAVGVT